ncbi:MAG: protein kinase [Planctomycetota bacterium]
MAERRADPGFWRRARELFDEVGDIPAEDRLRRLAELESDPEVRLEVEKLLSSLDDGTEFFVEPAERAAPIAFADSLPRGYRIGNYSIVEQLGHGGMGTVYEAEQDRPRRRVALKLLHSAVPTRRAVDRFVREAELLAHMDHPNIARVFEAGTHRDGAVEIPFFAMELVGDASTITRYVDSAAMPVPGRIDLFLLVCDAVQYGHQRGIIHRDLKPGNILVDGSDGRPKVIDFGVARTTESDLAVTSLQTAAHEIVGTLRYMSPEQCAGDSYEVDVRSDVYALGVVLYEMLTSELPYDFKSTSLMEIPRVITEVPPRRLTRVHDDDLNAVVMRALEKDPDHRYQSVRDLAEDLRRYVAGEPVEAKRHRKWYVLKKTVRRHRTMAALVGAVALFVTGSALALAVLYSRSERSAEALRRTGYLQTIALAENELARSRTDELHRLLESCPPDLRGWEWRHLVARSDESVATLPGSPFVAGALSPDGTTFANGTSRGVIEVWDLARRVRVAEHAIEADFVESLSFSDDGRLLAVATRSISPAFVIDARTGERELVIPADERVKLVLMLRGRAGLVTGSSLGALVIRDPETGVVRHVLSERGAWITALSLSARGDALAVGRSDGTIELWDLGRRERVFVLPDAHDDRVSGLAIAGDGSRIFSAGWDAVLKTWDADGGQVDVRRVDGDLIRGIAHSERDGLLAIVTPTSIEFRHTRDRMLARRVLGQSDALGAAFMPESSENGRVVTWSYDSIKTWGLEATSGAYVLAHHGESADAVAASPDGRWIAAATRGGGVTLWRAGDGVPIGRWQTGSDRVYRLDFDRSGSRLAAACFDGTVRVWSVPDGGSIHVSDIGVPAFHTAWCGDGTIIGVGAGGAFASLAGGETDPGGPTPLSAAAHSAVACHAPSGRIAIAAEDGTITILRPESGRFREIRTFAGHDDTIGDLAWSPDGGMLASGGNDAVVRVWDPESGRMLREMLGHGGLIKGLAFNADASRLASSAWEGEIRLWDTDSGSCVLRLRGHVGVVMDVAFTPDGDRLVSAGSDGCVRVWEADDGGG